MITEKSQLFIELYAHYDRQHLLVAGGVLDQPAPYLQAMRIISNAICDATKS